MTDPDPDDESGADEESGADPDRGGPTPGEPEPPGPSGSEERLEEPGEAGELRATAADDRARVQALTDRLCELEDLVGDLLDPPDPVAGPAGGGSAGSDGSAGLGPGGGPGRDPVPPVYSSLADFVTKYFIKLFDRPTRGGRWHWCPRWFDHGEAVSRLHALWQSWEALHAGGGPAFGLWYRDHLDHQLPILMGPDGPFRGCAEQHWDALDTDQLRSEPPPKDNRVWETA